MELENISDRIKQSKIIAVVRAPGVELVRGLARAYVDAGIEIIELTTSIPEWKDTLPLVVEDLGDRAVVGMGTVTSSFDSAAAIKLGAKFIVSPYVASEVIEQVAMDTRVPMIPGALTPTEIARAYELGANMVKVFPASAIGGPNYIKSLLAPMPHWELIPTGGVTPANALQYFTAGATAVGLGANMTPVGMIMAEDWPAVENHIRMFLDILNNQLKEISRLNDNRNLW